MTTAFFVKHGPWGKPRFKLIRWKTLNSGLQMLS